MSVSSVLINTPESATGHSAPYCAAELPVGHAVWRGRGVYTIGRACAVATRPLCLFLTNNYFGGETATAVAVTLLASALSLRMTAADVHLRFYLARFSSRPRSVSLPFHVYVVSVLMLTIIGGMFTVGVTAVRGGSAAVVMCSVAYFIGEQIADELLRFRLFEQNFRAWGLANIGRTTIQLTGLGAVYAMVGPHAPGALIIVALAFGTLVSFVPQLPLHTVRFATRPWVIRWLARRATRVVASNWKLWAIGLMGGLTGYLDRIVALMVPSDTLPVFALVVMACSVIPLSVDFYYVSPNRRTFLQRRLTLRAALASPAFLATWCGGIALAVGLAIGVLRFSHNGTGFQRFYLLTIVIVQSSAAIAVVPQQILYWNQEFIRILVTELLFWTLFACAVASAIALRLPGAAVFAAVAASAMIRVALYMRRAAADDEKNPEVPSRASTLDAVV